MTDNTLSTETSGDSFSAAEAAYFSSRGEDTSGLDSASPQDGAGSPPASGQADAPTNGKTPASGQETASADTSDGLEDGETVVILGKDGKPRSENGQFVSHKTFHAIREKYKSTREENAELRQKYARADERMTVLNEIISQADAPPAQQTKQPEAIDAEHDPIGALKAYIKKTADLEAQLAERDRIANDRSAMNSIRDAFVKEAQIYLREKPEFGDAYKFLLSNRREELEDMGISDPAARERIIAKEEHEIVLKARELGKSAPQMLHRAALRRGFQPTAPPPPADPNRLDPMAKIDALAKAQATAGASLSGAGGSSGEGLTRESLANMSESEFAEVANKLGKAKMRQLMGG